MVKPADSFSGSRLEVGEARLTWQEVAHGRDVLELWLEIRDDDDRVVAYRLVPEDGRPVVSEVRVGQYDEQARLPGELAAAAPLRGTDTRSLVQTETPLRTVRDIAEQQMAHSDWRRDVVRRFGFNPARMQPRRPQAISDDELALVAGEYVVELRRNSRSPTKCLAEQLSLSHRTVSRRVNAARDRDILTGGRGRGRSGGELTDYGRELLEQTQYGRELLEQSTRPAA